MGYQIAAIKGLSWVSLFRLFLRSSSFIRTIILARILSPQEFGIFGIAALVLGLLEMLTETGVNVVLVQQSDSNKNDLSYLPTAFTVSIVRGLLLFILLLLLILPTANFFNISQVIPLMLAFSLVPLLRGFINPAVVIFQKNLAFKAEFFYKASVAFFDALVAISTALLWPSAYSLVFGLLAGVVVELLVSHLIVKPKASFGFNSSQFLNLISGGKWLTLAGVLSFFSAKLPDIFLGKLNAPQVLGLYQMASRFSLLFVEEMTEIFNRVSFPIFVLIKDDKARLLRALKRHVSSFWLITLSVNTALYFISPSLLPLLLGNQWLPAMPYLQSLIIVSQLIAFSTPTHPLFFATKNQQTLSLIMLVQTLVLALSLYYFYTLGLSSAVVYAYGLSILVTLPIRWYFAIKYLH